MKKYTFIITILFLCCSNIVIAQNIWKKIELPDSVNICQIYCLDKKTVLGWCYNPLTLYKTSDEGESWKKVFVASSQGKKNYGVSISFINQNIGFLEWNRILYKTINAGDDWFLVGEIPNYGGKGQRLLALDEETIWMLGYYNFFISFDGGGTYQEVVKQSVTPYLEVGYSNGVGYAIDMISNVIKTTDKGKTWDFVSCLFMDEVQSGVVVTQHDLFVYSATQAIFGGEKHLITTDNGFQTISKKSYPNIYQGRKIVFRDLEHGMILIWGERGTELYYTQTGGNEWIQEFGFEDFILDVEYNDGVWYAISHGAIYKVIKNGNIIDNSLTSIKVYPNPTHDILTIESGEHTITKIEICDIFGKVVFSQDSPSHNTINIKNLPNGFYITKVIIENKTYQNKILKH